MVRNFHDEYDSEDDYEEGSGNHGYNDAEV
jgi:hypothetical protein